MLQIAATNLSTMAPFPCDSGADATQGFRGLLWLAVYGVGGVLDVT